MSPLLKFDENLARAHGDFRCGFDEVTKDLTGFGRLVPIGDLCSEKTIEARGHERQLQVAVNLERDGGREGIQMEEVDPISNAILDDHPLGITINQRSRRSFELIGQQEGRLFVAEISNCDLPNGSLVIRE